jgi:hypothetical protein
MNGSSKIRRLLGRPGVRVLAVVGVAALVVAAVAGAAGTRAQAVPSNSSLPSISGTATVGSTLTANPGTWSGSAPISFQYQWTICGANGGSCHNISGATAQTYTLAAADAGNTVRIHVIASNSEGSGTATSNASARIAAAPAPSGPVVSSPPTVTGDASVGGTLTANPGTWSGAAPISFKYQWLVCDGNGNACHDISGATSQSYTVQSADKGNSIRVNVTASNSSGSGSSISGQSGVVGAAPVQTGCPKLAAGAQSVAVADVTAPARLQVDQFGLTTGTITRNMTSFSARFHVADTCGQAVSGALVYVTAVPYKQVSIPAEAATDGSGWVTLTFNRQAGFPASNKQQLMVLFVRARRSGDPLLAGISTRRLVSLPVHLRG